MARNLVFGLIIGLKITGMLRVRDKYANDILRIEQTRNIVDTKHALRHNYNAYNINEDKFIWR